MKSLTDVVSGAGLSVYAEVALVIFLIAFLGVVVSLFVPSRQRMYERLRRLPIDHDDSQHRALTALYREDGDSSSARLPRAPAGLRPFARNDSNA